MNKTKILALTGTLAASTLMMSNAQALLIDNFNSGDQSIFVAQNGPVNASSTANNAGTLAPGDSVGTSRQIDLSAQAGGPNIIQTTVFGGVFGFSEGTGADGTALLIWNSQGTIAPPADLTDGGASTFLSMDLVSIDLGAVDFFFSIIDTGGNAATATINGGTAGQTVQAAFNTFANFGATDFTDIVEISLRLTGDPEQDITIDQIFTSGRVSVPEPASMLLLGVGIAGFGFSRRKLSKA